MKFLLGFLTGLIIFRGYLFGSVPCCSRRAPAHMEITTVKESSGGDWNQCPQNKAPPRTTRISRLGVQPFEACLPAVVSMLKQRVTGRVRKIRN
jgi:hypothetical protein